MNIVGGLGDQTIYYVWSRVSSTFSIKDPVLAGFFPYQFRFRYLINPLASNQPVLAVVSSLLTTLLGYNFLLLVTFLLNLIFSYIFFKRYRNGWVYTLIFCFSAYLMSHFGIHIALSQIWVFPMFFRAFFKWKEEKSLKSCLIIGVYVALTIFVSNYYGFFILLFLGVYSLSELITGKKRVYLLSMFVGVTVSIVFLFPYFKSAYFKSEDVHSFALERNMEDLFHFSIRPWYFVIPPVKNPFIGEVGRGLVSRFEATGYFLSDDYFAIEHMGSYFGLFLSMLSVVTSVYIFRKGSTELKQQVGSLWITLLILFSFTLPPYFTISGLRIFTPGFLIYRFFSMFRATARMSILFLFLLLVILGLGLDSLYEEFKDKKKLLNIFMFLVLLITIFETLVPLKVLKTGKSPEVFEYMKKNTPKESVFAIYPYEKTQDAFFWIPTHKRLLINYRDFRYEDFSAEVFTKKLNSEVGLSELKENGVNYLVVSEDVSDDEKEFFEISSYLELEKEFSEYTLFVVK